MKNPVLAAAARIRNIGIIAHIDAGKTTTTERMLYYAGQTRHLGNVDRGNTVTDFLKAERERGITIQSAAISMQWGNHSINLIDTPGHADFNFEVVRSLRVLDGVVTVVDAVAGIEALTERVWRLARKLNIPGILFVNKMDRAGAGFSRTVREAVTRLHMRPLVLNIPYMEGDRFAGITDIVRMRTCVYKEGSDGKEVDVRPAPPEAAEARNSLIEQLSEVDPEVLETFVMEGDVSEEQLVKSVRSATCANLAVPVLCGASFRNIGVQPLLDAIVDYLPSPKLAEPKPTDPVQCLAFKVRSDLVYIRVYQGILRKNATVYNCTTGKTERVSRLFRPHAEEQVSIDSAAAGEIAAIGGTSGIRTGDTLVAHPSKLNGASSLPKSVKETVLEPISIPPPVFFRRISPVGPGDLRGMNEALDTLLREDPSLHLSYDEEAGQHLLSGLGELHLEIACDRLVNDFKARIVISDVMITYKESLAQHAPAVEKSVSREDSNLCTTKVTVKIERREEPIEDFESNQAGTVELVDQNMLKVNFRPTQNIRKTEVVDAAKVGVLPVLARGGPLDRNALFGISITIDVNISPEAVSPELVAPLVREATSAALGDISSTDFVLLEPVMDVQITAPQASVGTVMTDLSTTRRGTIARVIAAGEETESSEEGNEFEKLASSLWLPVDHTMHMSKHGEENIVQPVTVEAIVPLRKMVGYLSSLRSMTQGRGSFEMSFNSFMEVPPQDVDELLNS